MKHYKVVPVKCYPGLYNVYEKKYFLFWLKIGRFTRLTDSRGSIEDRLKRFLSEIKPVYINVKE